MKPQAILGSVVVALGVATGSLLAPQAASAANRYNFDFSFGSGVTGTITNLVEGINPCNQKPDLPGVCVVSVSTVGTATGAGTGPYSFIVGDGFTVSKVGGQPRITAALWGGEQPSTGGNFRSELLFLTPGGDLNAFGALVNSRANERDVGFGVFRLKPQPPSTSVPGPLPVLGAAAAFGWSRKLRKRIKRSPSTGSTAPFA